MVQQAQDQADRKKYVPSVTLNLLLLDFWSPSPPSLPTHHPSQHTQGLDLTWTQQADHHQTRCNASSRNISIFRRKKKPGHSDWKIQEEDTADQPTEGPVKRWSRGCLLSPPPNVQSIIILSSITKCPGLIKTTTLKKVDKNEVTWVQFYWFCLFWRNTKFNRYFPFSTFSFLWSWSKLWLLKVFQEGGLPSKVVFHQRSSSIISYLPSKSVFLNWCWNVSVKCRAQYLSYLRNIASSLFCFVFGDLDNFRLSRRSYVYDN